MQDMPKDVGGPVGRGRLLAPADAKPLVPHRDPYAPVGYGQPGPEDGGQDLAQTVAYYVRLVLKRKWLIASLAVLFLAVGGLSTLMRTPLYTASVRVQIDRETAKIVEGGSTSPNDTNSTDFLRTQFELLKSRAMAERVVSSLQLQDDKDFLKPRDIALVGLVRNVLSPPRLNIEPSPAVLQTWATGLVAESLTVYPVPGSRLVDLNFTDPNPGRAQRVANAYAEAFIASTLDKRFQANSYAKTFLEDQIAQLKIRLEQSEKAQIEFAEQEKIIEVNEKSSIAENNLAAANGALGGLISERIKNEQLWRQVENADPKAIALPQLLTSGVIDGLRTRRNALVTEYQEKLETFKPGYPSMVQINQKIKEIDRQLAEEVRTIKASLKGAYESSAALERETTERVDQLRAEVLDLQKKGIRYNILKREVETNRGLYNSLLQRLKEVDIAGGVGTNNIFIVDRAQSPTVPTEPKVGRALILSLALGLGAGLALAYLLEIMDDRVRAPEEAEQIAGLALLGLVPKVDSMEGFRAQLDDPRSIVAEAYRSLATSLQFSTDAGLPRSLAITSSGPGEGKSSTSIAIARHFATMGMRVLLVDADMRKPSLHEKLGHDNTQGLSNYLTGSVQPPDVIQKTAHPNLSFMPSGPLPPNAADLLGGTRMFSLVTVGLEVYDLIVVDTPPMLGLADAQLLSSATAATVFVVGAGQQRKGLIRSALRRLRMARAPLVGIVLTKFDNKAVGYGYG